MSPEFATKIVHGVGAGEPGYDEAFADIRKGSDVWGWPRYTRAGGDPAEQTRDHLIRMLDIYKLRMTKAWPAPDARLATSY